MAEPVLVRCNRKDCVYYNQKPDDTLCYCSHPDKRHHMTEGTCPLYRLDWQKAAGKTADLKTRLRKK